MRKQIMTPVQAEIIKKLKSLGFESAQVINNQKVADSTTYSTGVNQNKREPVLVLR